MGGFIRRVFVNRHYSIDLVKAYGADIGEDGFDNNKDSST